MILALILFNICHWLGDYTHLSSPEMLKAKAVGRPLMPIFNHAVVHGLLMAFACGCIKNNTIVYWVWGIQTISHFIIDALKGRCNVWFPKLKDTSKYPYWCVFGLDQFAHQLVIISLAYMVSK